MRSPSLRIVGVCALALLIEPITARSDSSRGFSVGAAQRDISPPIGMEILHYFRNNIGIHDPLYIRSLVIEDSSKQTFALLTADLICAGFAASDELRERIKAETGVTEVWLNCSHNHSSRWLCSNRSPEQPWNEELQWDEYRDRPISESPKEAAWNQEVHDAAVGTVKEAIHQKRSCTLHVGRAPVQVGFNRRKQNAQGETHMGVNRDGAVVPWVNVLSARDKTSQDLIAVLFEHPAHPVTVPDGSRLVSADFPGAAVAKLRADLGSGVIALYGQGCCGNINSFPLRSSHEDATAAGHRLATAVHRALESSQQINTTVMSLRHRRIHLPTRALPTPELVRSLLEENRDNPARLKQLQTIERFRRTGTPPPPRRFDVNGLMIGNEWALIAMSYETFAEYELWIDQNAPFTSTMVLGLTNGGRAYIGTDRALSRGAKGGYEAACLPNWSGHETMSPHLGPPAVGTESMIQEAFQSLWQ